MPIEFNGLHAADAGHDIAKDGFQCYQRFRSEFLDHRDTPAARVHGRFLQVQEHILWSNPERYFLSRIPKIGMTVGTLAHLSAAQYAGVSIYARKRR